MDTRPTPAVLAIVGIVTILISFLDIFSEDPLLRIIIGAPTLRIIGVLCLITAAYKFIVNASKRKADANTAKELLELIKLCAKMGADECVIGIEDGACLVLAGFGEEGPQEIRRFPAADFEAFTQAFFNYLSDQNGSTWVMPEDILPEEVGTAVGTMVSLNDGEQVLIISLSYQDRDNELFVRKEIFEAENA